MHTSCLIRSLVLVAVSSTQARPVADVLTKHDGKETKAKDVEEQESSFKWALSAAALALLPAADRFQLPELAQYSLDYLCQRMTSDVAERCFIAADTYKSPKLKVSSSSVSVLSSVTGSRYKDSARLKLPPHDQGSGTG